MTTTKTPATPAPKQPAPKEDRRYCAVAVEKAIQASNRAGRRISGKEARMIHALLRGRA